MHTCMYACMYICLHTRMYRMHVHAYTHACTCVYTHTHTCTHTHTHTHACTHIYIHTNMHNNIICIHMRQPPACMLVLHMYNLYIILYVSHSVRPACMVKMDTEAIAVVHYVLACKRNLNHAIHAGMGSKLHGLALQ